MTEHVDVAVLLQHATDKAVLVRDGDRQVWIPFSVLERFGPDDAFRKGEARVLSVAAWFAERAGLL